MKFLRTIRFDPSDTHVFEHAAEEGEWAISGGFWFGGISQADLKGKRKQAFSNGFLSLESFGFSTFTSVTRITEEERGDISERLSNKLLSDFGAPSIEAARAAAQEEIDYVSEMCAKIQTNAVFGLKRKLDEKNEIRESFTLIEQNDMHSSTRIWEIVE